LLTVSRVATSESSCNGLKEKTDEVYQAFKRKYDSFLDQSGAIGRRYRRLDEVGVPFAITIDHQTLQDDTVTLRDRDSIEQNRIKVSEIDSCSLQKNCVSTVGNCIKFYLK